MIPKIMIVDDAAFMRMLLKDILEGNGFQIVGQATNGNESIQKYRELNPDVVTMDIMMPGMDGIQAIKGIKAMDPDARIIICSAMGQKERVVEAIKAGAKDFIFKPFKPEQVIQTLRKNLKDDFVSNCGT